MRAGVEPLVEQEFRTVGIGVKAFRRDLAALAADLEALFLNGRDRREQRLARTRMDDRVTERLELFLFQLMHADPEMDLPGGQPKPEAGARPALAVAVPEP